MKQQQGSVEHSWRFGQYRRWHPDHKFLYEVIEDGERMWTSICRFPSGQSVTEGPSRQTQ